MKTDVVSVRPNMPMSSLREILKDNRISGTPVIEDDHLVGIVSVEDFIQWLSEGAPESVIADRMTENVVTLNEDDPLIQAISKLERFGFGRLPVVSRSSGELLGVLTKGDSIAGLLRKLDVDYRQAEIRNARSSHIFQDVVAERSALSLEYDVPEKDLSAAGTSASRLKTTLLRLGFSPQIVRRATIAVYEAEMNLIFYATGGRITVMVEPERIRLIVSDDGPGISDVEKALEPGYSTAPEWVRELGFGAGMGLHNINTCADAMNLTSTVGEGTQLVVDMLLEERNGVARDR